jgi:dolichol-phosphate mannosyltransferase
MVEISVVIPVFKTETYINELAQRLLAVLNELGIEFEILFIDDGSPDNSWTLIETLANQVSQIRGIKLSRNFGQHSAIAAGLTYASGNWIVVMDGDLQDLPEDIPVLYRAALNSSNSVIARRMARDEKFLKKFSSNIFYKIFSKLTGSSLTHEYGNFGIYTRKVIDSINRMPENERSFGLFAEWVGFQRSEVLVSRAKRGHDKSSYTFGSLFRLAGKSIVSYSNKPLYLVTSAGFVILAASVTFAIALLVRYLIFGVQAQGWTSLMVALFLNTGLIIGTLGIIGIYIGSVFNEVKRRPQFLIDTDTQDR